MYELKSKRWRMMLSRLSCFALVASIPLAANAHVGGHDGATTAAAFLQGLAHPFGGLDHVLAMIAVGVFAARLGRTALWAVPTGFMAAMLLGGAVGLRHTGLTGVELGIAASVLGLGGLIAWRRLVPVAAATGIVGLFAICHGYAHGAEMPAQISASSYVAGFLVATAALHAVGLALGLAALRLTPRQAGRFQQATGAGLTIAGAAMLLGWV
jgi:urease accessory protein